MPNNMDLILDLIREELRHQEDLWGANRVRDAHLWLVVLGEEYGEVCRASLEHDEQQFISELVDVAAVAISAIQSVMLDARYTVHQPDNILNYNLDTQSGLS